MGVDGPVSVGEARKATQDGRLPIGSVKDILDKAPADLAEEVLEIPEWGCSVRVRSLTAAQSARIRTRGYKTEGERTTIAWAAMEQMQFQEAVVEPKFSERDVQKLHLKSGRGFARVLEWIEEHSKIDKEALREIQKEFPGSEEPSEV